MTKMNKILKSLLSVAVISQVDTISEEELEAQKKDTKVALHQHPGWPSVTTVAFATNTLGSYNRAFMFTEKEMVVPAGLYKFYAVNKNNSYDYENHKFNLNEDKLLVNNGYVELEIEDTDLFYLTQAKLDNKEVVVNNTVVNNSSSLVIILASALTLLVLFNIWYFFIKKPKQYVG